MGLMRFLVPRQEQLLPSAVEQAYMAGRDDVPWRTQIIPSRDGLVAERSENDSGLFYIPWLVEGHGELMLCTATLMERGEPYLLPLELARGTLNRLRTYMSVWEGIGLEVPPELQASVAQAVELFARAATSQYDPFLASDRAHQTIRVSLDAVQSLGMAYAEQAGAVRRLQPHRPQPLLGVNLGRWRPHDPSAAKVTDTFNSVGVTPSWRSVETTEGKQRWTRYDAQVQWCQGRGLRLAVGPLVQLNQHFLPDWLYLWESDFENLLELLGQHIQSVVIRYRGRTNLWHCAAGLNTDEALPLSDEQRLRLAVRALEVTRKHDPRTPMVISFGQPWGEYLSDRDTDLSPLVFADTLARAELGVSAFGLEINVGEPGAPAVRDELELSRLIDRWSVLGIPLLIYLAIPADGQSESQPDLQHIWLQRYVPLLLARPSVQGVFWNQLQDTSKSSIPSAGLFTRDGAPKPVVRLLHDIRKRYLV